MSGERFTLDTNVLVYSVDGQAGPRRIIAAEIIEKAVLRDCWLTLQAVSEFYASATRKGLVTAPDAAAQAEDWMTLFPCAAASPGAVRAALAAAAAGRAHYWDALLVATAAEAGCSFVLTEDMADGDSFAGVTVLNPFSGASLAPEARRLLEATG
jgi:predicted nucleic acid-binding protein